MYTSISGTIGASADAPWGAAASHGASGAAASGVGEACVLGGIGVGGLGTAAWRVVGGGVGSVVGVDVGLFVIGGSGVVGATGSAAASSSGGDDFETEGAIWRLWCVVAETAQVLPLYRKRIIAG